MQVAASGCAAYCRYAHVSTQLDSKVCCVLYGLPAESTLQHEHMPCGVPLQAELPACPEPEGDGGPACPAEPSSAAAASWSARGLDRQHLKGQAPFRGGREGDASSFSFGDTAAAHRLGGRLGRPGGAVVLSLLSMLHSILEPAEPDEHALTWQI